VAVEIKDCRPADWSPVLLEAWGRLTSDPVSWAKAIEKLGVRLLVLALSAVDEAGNPNTPAKAVRR